MAKFEGCWAVLCFEQMATKTEIQAEDYLRMTFEHDAEFVHGEIVERSMPDLTHSRIQTLIAVQVENLRQQHRLFGCVELRMRVAPDVYRIPDVAIFAGKLPEQQVPDKPPLIAVEILSKDDRYSDLMQKLEEYREWGVPHIWVIDPSTKRFSLYTERGLENVSSLSLSDYPFQLTPTELFADL
jgi:Uma2 family endonuclease